MCIWTCLTVEGTVRRLWLFALSKGRLISKFNLGTVRIHVCVYGCSYRSFTVDVQKIRTRIPAVFRVDEFLLLCVGQMWLDAACTPTFGWCFSAWGMSIQAISVTWGALIHMIRSALSQHLLPVYCMLLFEPEMRTNHFTYFWDISACAQVMLLCMV